MTVRETQRAGRAFRIDHGSKSVKKMREDRMSRHAKQDNSKADKIKIGDVQVELTGMRLPPGDPEEFKKRFAAKLAPVAAFMGCTRVQYFDGKTDRYVFHKADGTALRLEPGFKMVDATAWTKIKLLDKEKPEGEKETPRNN